MKPFLLWPKVILLSGSLPLFPSLSPFISPSLSLSFPLSLPLSHSLSIFLLSPPFPSFFCLSHIIYLMYVPSSFSYCYHAANETISALAQSDPIKWLSPDLSLSLRLSFTLSPSLSFSLLLSPSLSPSLSLSLPLSLTLFPSLSLSLLLVPQLLLNNFYITGSQETSRKEGETSQTTVKDFIFFLHRWWWKRRNLGWRRRWNTN